MAGVLLTALEEVVQGQGNGAGVGGGGRRRRRRKKRHDPGDDKRRNNDKRKDKRKDERKRKGKGNRKDHPTTDPTTDPTDRGICAPTTCAARGKNCGTIADGCGNQIRCGPDSCGDGFSCTENVCRCPDGNARCQGGCCQAGEVCENGDGACCTAQGQTAACTGRECGPATDRCTGAVYACGLAGDDCAVRGFTCTAAGQCQCDASRLTCPTSGASPTCCQSGQVCRDGTGVCCTPITCAAEGKNCGFVANGCDGLRLDCGTCRLAGQPCDANVCGTCVPNCDGKRCGADDECGGTCLTGTCSGNQICDGGRCHDCDVCLPAGACPYRSVQAAVDPGGPATIRICSGIYVEDSTAQFRAVNTTRSLRLVGSGDGLDPTTNTHLRPKITSKQVVGASGDSGIIEVTLDRLHITGGTGANGRGVGFASVIGTISNCTITGNESRLSGGGLGAFITNTRVTLINTHVTNNTGLGAGGIGVGGNVRVTLDALSRVTRNVATAGFGGIRNDPGGIVDLAIVANVTGNFSSGTNPNCGGGGQFNGDGMICQSI